MAMVLVDEDCGVGLGRRILSCLDSVFDKLENSGAGMSFYWNGLNQFNVGIVSRGLKGREIFNEGELILEDLARQGEINISTIKCCPAENNGLITIEYNFSIDRYNIKLNYEENF